MCVMCVYRNREREREHTIIVLSGIGAGCQLSGGRSWEDKDMCTGSILRCVELRSLQIQSSAATKH